MKSLWSLVRLLWSMRAASLWQYCLSLSMFWLSYCGYQFAVIDRLSAGFFEVLSMIALWFFYIKILLVALAGLRKNRNVHFVDTLKRATWMFSFCVGVATFVSSYIMAIQFLSFLQISILMSLVMAMSGFLYRKQSPLRDVLILQYVMVPCVMLFNVYMLLRGDEIFNIVSGLYLCLGVLMFLCSVFGAITSYCRWMQHVSVGQVDKKLHAWKSSL